MKVLIIILFALRPVLFWDLNLSVADVRFFELSAIVMSFCLILAAYFGALGRRWSWVDNSADIFVLFFTVWCISLYGVHADSDIKRVMQYILPLIGFLVVARYFQKKRDIILLLKWTIIGFSLPVLVTFYMTITGKGLGQTIYWTGTERYQGVYSNIHNMGHNMMVCVFLSALYFDLSKRWQLHISVIQQCLISTLALIAIFCLLKSVVRTAFVSLVIFLFVWLWSRARYLLFFLVVAALVLGTWYYERLLVVFFDVVGALSEGGNIDDAGSGRVLIWNHNIAVLNEGGFFSWISGVGVGNTLHEDYSSASSLALNSHNDYLDLIVNTGLVGFALYTGLTVCFLLNISNLPRVFRPVFMAILLAVIAANVFSNSYIDRFGLAQLFMMLMGVQYGIVKSESRKNDGSSTRSIT